MTSEEGREARWLRLAGAIADGGAGPAEEPLDEEDREVLRGLALVARIGAVHRGWPATFAGLRVLEELGRGGAGRVHRAFDPAVRREVALKLVQGRAGLQEARRLARVRHPGVVTVFGAAEEGGLVGLWMELISGATLQEVLDRQGRFGPQEAALIGVEVCRALAAVHAAGLVHGDVTARNVMRQEGGRLVLMDFGLGRPATLTAAGGTPPYLAPEVLRGEPASARSDVYALGALLFLLVTGEHALPAHSLAEARDAWRTAGRRHLRDLRPDLPERFVVVLERALEPEPSRRFASAGAFESALLAVLDLPRPRWWPAATLAVAVVVVAGLVRPNAPEPARPGPVPPTAEPPRIVELRPTPRPELRADPFARPLAPAGLDTPASTSGPYSLQVAVDRAPGVARVTARASSGLRLHLLAEDTSHAVSLLLPANGAPGQLLRPGEPERAEVALADGETLMLAAARSFAVFDDEVARLRVPGGARRASLPPAALAALRQDLGLPPGPGLAAHAAPATGLVEVTSGAWLRRVDPR
jgi:hypothetical protein